jgi:nitrate/nitrite-specific signal transduction histidine kinase
MKAEKQRSLSLVVALWTAGAIALAMGVYATFQYFTVPERTLLELVMEHLWHVLVLGLLIYVLCWLVFRIILLRPLNQIYMHLYGVGTGRLEPLQLSTRIRELQTIAEGVNVMIRRMGQGYDPEAIEHCRNALASLRKSLKKLSPSNRETATEMLQELARLERAVLSIVRTSLEEKNGSALQTASNL